MAEQLSPRDDLDRAIRRWLANETSGGLATDYILFSAYLDPARHGTGYHLALSEGISYHAASGLAGHLPAVVEDTFTGDEDD
ncbi:hypothetical protein [Nocardia pseudobrasiliensis]|uniref:Uncharacterized protein n=1 Tax=Nocardia pseudobrasiliensis TaxID=45979 RepID=A0A370I4Q4_9NOCA|nr:hypothetical protein [Nocardia pseudobrasiliensis]RDI65726.1 hypothetical protein DFR76_10541 [Nocardia pseudobrasiliensis]